jgi:hypothetical protein
MLKRLMFLVGLAAPATAAVAQSVATTANGVNTLPVTTINLQSLVNGLLKRVTALERQVAALNTHTHTYYEPELCIGYEGVAGFKEYINGTPGYSNYGNYVLLVKGDCPNSGAPKPIQTGPPVMNKTV